MQKAKVFRNNVLAGFITKFSENSYSFIYDEKYLQMKSAKPISINFPLQKEEFASKHLFSFFYNLLAEGTLKDIQCKKLRIDRNDDFSRLLLTTSENTIGSITIQKEDEK